MQPPLFGVTLLTPNRRFTNQISKKGRRLLRGTIVNTGPTVYTKTYIFTYFYLQYLVLFTMVPRNSYYHVLLRGTVLRGTIVNGTYGIHENLYV